EPASAARTIAIASSTACKESAPVAFRSCSQPASPSIRYGQDHSPPGSAYGMPIAATTSRGGSVRNISVRRAISYMFVALPGAPAPEDCPCDFTKGACDDRVVRDTVTSQTRQVRTALRGPGPRPRPAALLGAGR